MKPPAPEQMALFQIVEPVHVSIAALVLAPHQPSTERSGVRRIDWFRVITMVLRGGYSIQGAADAIGVARTTLIGWKQGAEPRYTEGEWLVQLWIEVTKLDRSNLPLVAVADCWAYHSKV